MSARQPDELGGEQRSKRSHPCWRRPRPPAPRTRPGAARTKRAYSRQVQLAAEQRRDERRPLGRLVHVRRLVTQPRGQRHGLVVDDGFGRGLGHRSSARGPVDGAAWSPRLRPDGGPESGRSRLRRRPSQLRRCRHEPPGCPGSPGPSRNKPFSSEQRAAYRVSHDVLHRASDGTGSSPPACSASVLGVLADSGAVANGRCAMRIVGGVALPPVAPAPGTREHRRAPRPATSGNRSGNPSDRTAHRRWSRCHESSTRCVVEERRSPDQSTTGNTLPQPERPRRTVRKRGRHDPC